MSAPHFAMLSKFDPLLSFPVSRKRVDNTRKRSVAERGHRALDFEERNKLQLSPEFWLATEHRGACPVCDIREIEARGELSASQFIRNGGTSCATSILAQKCASDIAAPTGRCAPTPRGQSPPPASPLPAACPTGTPPETPRPRQARSAMPT